MSKEGEGLSAAKELADAMLRAAGSALRYYEPHTRTRIVGIAAKAIGEVDELRGRSKMLGEWAEHLQAICEKHGALGGDDRIDFIEHILDAKDARIAELALRQHNAEAYRRGIEDAAKVADAHAIDAGDMAARGFYTSEERAARNTGRGIASAIRALANGGGNG